MDLDLSGGQAPWPWAVPPPCHQTLLPSPSLEGGTREAGPGQLGCRPDCNWKLCSFLAPPGGLGSPGKRKQVCEPSPQWLRWAKPQAALPMCTSTQVPCQICQQYCSEEKMEMATRHRSHSQEVAESQDQDLVWPFPNLESVPSAISLPCEHRNLPIEAFSHTLILSTAKETIWLFWDAPDHVKFKSLILGNLTGPGQYS